MSKLPEEKRVRNKEGPQHINMADENSSSDIQITLTPNQQATAAKVLSAFPSFKKNKLPDYLRLSKWHLHQLKKWHRKAQENRKTPTFSGTFSFTVGALSLCENVVHCNEDSIQSQNTFDEDIFFDISSDEYDADVDEEENDEDFLKWIRALDKRQESFERRQKQSDNLDEILLKSMAPVMHKMAAKELNYKPYKAMEEALEEWISKEMELRNKQLTIVRLIVGLYEEQQEDEDSSITETRQSRILEYMTKLKELGKLPPEVEKKAQEQFQMNPLVENLNEMMDSVFDGMFAMYEGIATEGQDKNNDEQKLEAMDCALM